MLCNVKEIDWVPPEGKKVGPPLAPQYPFPPIPLLPDLQLPL